MRSLLCSCVLAGGVLAAATPAGAQNAAIAASATVLPRPLSLLAAAMTAVPGELRVRIDGCSGGALTVDVRTAEAVTRVSRAVIDPAAACAPRAIALQLPVATGTALAFVVTLEQPQALTGPSFAQFVVPVSALAPTRAY